MWPEHTRKAETVGPSIAAARTVSTRFITTRVVLIARSVAVVRGGTLATTAWVTAMLLTAAGGPEGFSRSSARALTTVVIAVIRVMVFQPIANAQSVRDRAVARSTERTELARFIASQAEASLRCGTEHNDDGASGSSGTTR